MRQPRFPYILTCMTFLAVASWFSLRAYSTLIGQIYYGPIKGVMASVFRLVGNEPGRTFRTRAAIYYSNATAASLREPDQYDALMGAWRKLLDQQQISNGIVDSKALLSRSLRSYNVLILPLASHLSDAEVVAIKEFVSHEGRGLIFCGAAGSRRENGDWRELSMAAEIIGGEAFTEVSPPEASGKAVTMVLDGRSPLSANIPPGLRMSINTYDRPVSVRLLEPRTQAAAVWEEKVWSPVDMTAHRAGIASGTYLGGRFVWSGFTLGSQIDPFGVKAGEILVRNMVAYASFKPIFAKEPWPHGKQAAVVFAEVTASAHGNSGDIAALFSEKRVPCTFFMTPEAIRTDPVGLKALSSDPLFELALQGSASYQTFPLERQKEILARDKLALEALSGRPVSGFSPMDPAGEPNTLGALLDSGFSYMTGRPANGEPPSVLQARKTKYIRLGRNLNLFIEFPHAPKSDEGKTLARLKEEFDAVYRVGGFYTVSFHGDTMKDAKQKAVLAQFIDYVKSRNVWLATFNDAAEWSSRWRLVDVDSISASKIRTTLIVSNSSPGMLDRLSLTVHLPATSGDLTARAEKTGGSIHVIARHAEKAVIEIRNLHGEGQVFYVDRPL